MTWHRPDDVRAAFFDVDGTLTSFATHEVPASAHEALRRLRSNGIMTFLATGRPRYQLQGVDASDFDGFVTINGQYCYTGDRLLYRHPLDPDDVQTVVGQVEEGLYACLFQEEDRFYASGRNGRVRDLERTIGLTYPVADVSRTRDHDIYQLCAFLLPGEDHVLLDATENLKMARWTPLFADVMPKHGGKSLGILKMLDTYGLRPEQAVAFGDGGNDLGMFGVVGTSVAMGNGNPEVKEAADYVTDDVDHDGILNACARLGLV